MRSASIPIVGLDTAKHIGTFKLNSLLLNYDIVSEPKMNNFFSYSRFINISSIVQKSKFIA